MMTDPRPTYPVVPEMSDCICGVGYGMNLSCPVHARRMEISNAINPRPTAPPEEGSGDLERLLDEFALYANRSQDADRRKDNSYIQADAELAAARKRLTDYVNGLRAERDANYRAYEDGERSIAELEAELELLRSRTLSAQELDDLDSAIADTRTFLFNQAWEINESDQEYLARLKVIRNTKLSGISSDNET